MAGPAMAAPFVVEASQPNLNLEDVNVPKDSQSRPTPPHPPQAPPGSIVAFDITSKFRHAVQTLGPGEIVKDGFFTLHESVSALEIMDPKMDSGCLEHGETLDVDYDVTQALLPEEVVGIIDQLLCHEMAWHLGYPLSQTVLTCVYIESILVPQPATLEEAHFIRDPNKATSSPMHTVLRAYCLGLLKACGQVNAKIINEHYYEEEDFVTNTYNRDLLDDFSVEAICQVLRHATALLDDLSESVPQPVTDALRHRLLLRHTLLGAVDSLQERNDPSFVRASWQRPCREALSNVGRIKETHALGRPVPAAFSAKLQRRLASTMPPRPIVHLSFDDAFGHLLRLLKDGIETANVLDYHDSQSLQTFVMMFQAAKPQPLVFVRSLLQGFLFKDMEILGGMSIRQLLDDDLSMLVLPSSVLLDRANDEVETPHDPRFIIAEQMEYFRQKAAQPFLDILRTFCQNRCRVRRTFCHVVRDWDNLQSDADDMDQILQYQTGDKPIPRALPDGSTIATYARPLWSWVFLYKLKQMEWIVFLGFELEVYQPDELAGMYYFLHELANVHLQHIGHIRNALLHNIGAIRGGPRPHVVPPPDAQLARSLTFIHYEEVDASNTMYLAQALSCLYVALHRLSLLRRPRRPYGTDELRYELRMKPFLGISDPRPPSFAEFEACTTMAEYSTDDLLDTAAQCAMAAKKGLESMSKLSEKDCFAVGSYEQWTQRVKSALKSGIATSLAVSMVQKALARPGRDGNLNISVEVPRPEKAYHEWWIVPQVRALSA
ncbi:Mak10-domain-containing protein [Sodiomyces alkalinus F11]|uniref:Mak10-domain-containing protein n=1 Tax=Sodiomyces alkalinus (strain CBS 110278 / VKM F-3762 / F11) TaxID=1314773 RepID=A0A3N2Q941_SODAK|nr:Mak10-domain-containing protein [Sodiomyces alkalinus F11]ROT43301.1 Mak10-domain-containing protein [Sodiomyces alkalinus F11]